MGSVVRFVRPRPRIRLPQKPDAGRESREADRESREARRALLILIWVFFGTALVMCIVVVAAVSSTWTDVAVMSAFVLVFALAKILLANGLIYALLHADANNAAAVGHIAPLRWHFSPSPFGPETNEPHVAAKTATAKTGALRLASAPRARRRGTGHLPP